MKRQIEAVSGNTRKMTKLNETKKLNKEAHQQYIPVASTKTFTSSSILVSALTADPFLFHLFANIGNIGIQSGLLITDW